MNKKEFIEALARMEKPVIGDTAKKYAAALGISSSLTKQLQIEGYLKPGQCTLDLMEADPETVAAVEVWKTDRKMIASHLAALNRLLAIYDELNKDAGVAVRSAYSMKQPSMKQVVADKTQEPPLSLYGLLSGLGARDRRTVVDKKAYVLLMEALLLEDGFVWSPDTTETDLRVWGRRYSVHAENILANLKEPDTRSEVCTSMEDALLQLVDFNVQEILQSSIAEACSAIEIKMEDWYMNHLKEASDYPASQARLVLYQLASMENGPGEELYRDISLSQLTEKVVDLFELALWAAKGYYPLADDSETVQAGLNGEELDFLAAVGCGIPVKRTFIKEDAVRTALRTLMDKGLLRVRNDGLMLAPTLKSLPLTRLTDGCGNLKKIPATQLLLQLLKKRTAEHADTDMRVTLLRNLENLAEKLSEGTDRSIILNFLTDWYWINAGSGQAEAAIHATEKLLNLIEAYSVEMSKILSRKLGKNSHDVQLRLIQRNGSTLLEAELQSHCAGRCLNMAKSEEKKDTGGYWALCTVNSAKKALQKLELTPETFIELKTWCILASGYMLQAAEETSRSEAKWPYSAETITREYIIPCLEALKEAECRISLLDDAHRDIGKELVADIAAAYHKLIAEEDSPVYRCLDNEVHHFYEDCESDRWFDLEWVKTSGLEKVSDNRDLLQIIHRQDRPAKLFLPWYCNTFDSTLACGPVCTQELTEASMLNILLSGQKVTLSANQLVDNEYMWNLAQVPAFQWLMRNGYVTVSMFGSLNRLMDYAVTRMDNPNFHWSSLPEAFNDVTLRRYASDYFRGGISAAMLPEAYRMILIRMKEGIRLMDENLPESWCSYYHQADEELTKMRGIGPLIPLSKRITDYYRIDRDIEHYYNMRELNSILISANPNLDRSVYRKMIWAIEAEDTRTLKRMGVDLSALDECGLNVDFLAAEGVDMMMNMIRIIDDCQNRMLGERISTYQYYVYDEASARIVPEWHAGPVNDSGKLSYRQIEKDIQEDGILLGWGQVPERILELERLAEDNPKADAERLCSRLSNMGLSDYGIFGLDESLRLKNLAFRASSGKAAGREYTEEKDEGELFQVEKDLKSKE